MPDNTKGQRGWGSPDHARKPHYFIKTRSLCDRWLFTGALHDFRADDANLCQLCQRKLAQMDAKEREGEQLLYELALVFRTTLPCKEDVEVEERVDAVEELIERLETFIQHMFGPGGQLWKKGYSLTLERK